MYVYIYIFFRIFFSDSDDGRIDAAPHRLRIRAAALDERDNLSPEAEAHLSRQRGEVRKLYFSQSVTWLLSLIFPLFLNPFPLSDLDETFYKTYFGMAFVRFTFFF